MKPGMFMSGCQRNPRFEQLRMADDISRPGFRDGTLELVKGKNALEFPGGAV